jgi:hypothetical protein
MMIATADWIAKTNEYKSAHEKSRSKTNKNGKGSGHLQWGILKKMTMS